MRKARMRPRHVIARNFFGSQYSFRDEQQQNSRSRILNLMRSFLDKEVKIKIIDFATKPWGWLKLGNYKFMVFVNEKYLFPNDVVLVKIKSIEKRFFLADLISVERSNFEHAKDIVFSCQHYNSCFSCNLLHFSYEYEKKFKKKKFFELLNNVIEKSNFASEPNLREFFVDFASKVRFIFSPIKTHYRIRSRMIFQISNDPQHKQALPIVRFTDSDDIENCLINHNTINKVLFRLKNEFLDYYNKRIKKSYFSRIRLFDKLKSVNNKEFEFMISLSYDLEEKNNEFCLDVHDYGIFVDFNKNYSKLIKKIFYNLAVSDDKNRITVIKSRRVVVYKKQQFLKYRLIFPKNLLRSRIINYNFLPGMFIQINPYINYLMIKSLLTFFSNKKINSFSLIFDAFSGNGNFSIPLLLKKPTFNYIAVESNNSSIRALQSNLYENNIASNHVIKKNFEFKLFTQDLTNKNEVNYVFKHIKKSFDKLKQLKMSYDHSSEFVRDFRDMVSVMVIDPPRELSAQKLLDKVSSMFDYIVYISCNPKIAVKDYLAIRHNFELLHAYVFDMFPSVNHHFELMLILKNLNNTDHF